MQIAASNVIYIYIFIYVRCVWQSRRIVCNAIWPVHYHIRKNLRASTIFVHRMALCRLQLNNASEEPEIFSFYSLLLPLLTSSDGPVIQFH